MLVTCPECGHQISHEARRCQNCGLPRAGWKSKEWQDHCTGEAERGRQIAAVRRQQAIGCVITHLDTIVGHSCGFLQKRRYIDFKITGISDEKITGTALCCGKEEVTYFNTLGAKVYSFFFGAEAALPPLWMK